jgi:Transposase C of IS166 homeodomain
MQFPRSSEKIARTIEQLELKLEKLEAETTVASGIHPPRRRSRHCRSINHCPRMEEVQTRLQT